ncbi:MAG: arginine--tRNA ligase [Acidobacteria bacterium RIFCSPLOWO2_12_FULL_54_10]|nr:MAG: arginine--tRNA ligase [Acidobacteria bacterium RIFCSPLOWO2_12_FULL_54_10]
MYLYLQQQIQDVVKEFAKRQFDVDANVVVNQPPRAEMGDMALPLAMELARTLRRAPRQIAEEVAAELKKLEIVERVEIAGAGYVNLYFKRAAYATAFDQRTSGASTGKATGEKIIVEHTNINPNKAAHIGHLRNAALGDTFVRLLRSRGRNVEVQNYIDNTGVQVADVVAGFLNLEKKSAEEVRRLTEDPAVRFDYYCWDLYAKVSRFLAEQADGKAMRSTMLREIEAGGTEAARMAEIVSTAIVRAHLKTMHRLGVEYDLLPRESEILHLRFWDQAFALLKAKGAVYLETAGKNSGCWVMQYKGSETEDETAANEEDTKVIVRSNSTVTYVGKDMAYQLWKFGLLGKDFYYQPFHTYPDGHVVWMSSSERGKPSPAFGNGKIVYNVIDTRQSYLQDIVAAGLRALGYAAQADRSIHFSYEMVALSPRCCEEMGIELSPEEQKRPYIEVSGRKGLGVKADDLIDRLTEEALREVAARHPDKSQETKELIARQIAIGALRYFLLKYTCNAVIAFDFREALSFEGETGPYVQYAVVRARNIFRKLAEEGEGAKPVAISEATLAKFLAPPDGDAFWSLLYLISQRDAAAEQAVVTTEPAAVAKYAFQLAQAFNNFYHRFHILTEQNPERKAFLLWLVRKLEEQLTATLGILGIEAPKAM